MASPAGAKKHVSRLDVLRGVAFLMVLGVHFCLVNKALEHWKGQLPDYSHWPSYAYPFIPLSWGMYGVSLFLVISGYCIHLSYMRNPAAFEWKGFYWRRLLRLYPAYIVSMAVCLSLQPFRHHVNDWSIWQIPTHLLFIHNLFDFNLFYGINGVYWSLALEVQFYVLYPLLILGRQRWGINNCFALSLVLHIVGLVGIYFANLEWTSEGRSAVMAWCDWILGACLAEAHVNKKHFFTNGKVSICVSFVIFIGCLQFHMFLPEIFLFSSVFFCAVMDRYLVSQAAPSLIERALIPVGIISYSLYLWHLPILYFVHDLIPKLGVPFSPWRFALIDVPVTFVILGAIGAASWHYVEVGVPRWLKRHKMVPHVDQALPEMATVKMPSVLSEKSV
jgi:peptidoglycan/LPS O-acetylase OafA/YrhL